MDQLITPQHIYMCVYIYSYTHSLMRWLGGHFCSKNGLSRSTAERWLSRATEVTPKNPKVGILWKLPQRIAKSFLLADCGHRAPNMEHEEMFCRKWRFWVKLGVLQGGGGRKCQNASFLRVSRFGPSLGFWWVLGFGCRNRSQKSSQKTTQSQILWCHSNHAPPNRQRYEEFFALAMRKPLS